MNHALELLVLRKYGEEKWAEIKYGLFLYCTARVLPPLIFKNNNESERKLKLYVQSLSELKLYLHSWAGLAHFTGLNHETRSRLLYCFNTFIWLDSHGKLASPLCRNCAWAKQNSILTDTKRASPVNRAENRCTELKDKEEFSFVKWKGRVLNRLYYLLNNLLPSHF